jgi:hypothetical protein
VILRFGPKEVDFEPINFLQHGQIDPVIETRFPKNSILKSFMWIKFHYSKFHEKLFLAHGKKYFLKKKYNSK